MGSAAVTIAGAVGAATTTSTVAMVAGGVFATIGAASGIASLTAWAAKSDSNTQKPYFEVYKDHLAKATVALTQLVAQTIFVEFVKAVGQGVGDAVISRFTGNNVNSVRVR